MNQLELPIRNAGLYSALRRYVDEALALLRAERDAGAEVSFSVGMHQEVPGEHGLYEYRPLIERFVIERAQAIAALPGAEEAAWVVASDPAVAGWLKAGRAGELVELEQVARDEILIPLVCRMAELHEDLSFDEEALLHSYMRLEKAFYGDGRRYAAAIPIHGLRLAAGDLKLADGVRVRRVDPELFRLEWPEAAQLNWGTDGRDGLPEVILEFERLVADTDSQAALDPLPAVEQFVAAVRALAGGAVHAGPYVFERFDYRTLAPRPVSAVSALRAGDVTSTLTPQTAAVLPRALRRLSADPRGSLARSLERFQVASGVGEASSLRLLLDAICDIYADEGEYSAAGLRLAAVVGVSLAERRQLADAMHTAAVAAREGRVPDEETRQAARLLAAGLRATLAAALVGELPLTHVQTYADGLLLGERERRALGVASLQPVLQV